MAQKAPELGILYVSGKTAKAEFDVVTVVVLDFSKLHDSKWFFKKKQSLTTLAVGEQLQISSKSPKESSGAPISRADSKA